MVVYFFHLFRLMYFSYLVKLQKPKKNHAIIIKLHISQILSARKLNVKL